MAVVNKHSPFGIGVIAFLIAVSVSIGFYQFAYLPIITAKPQIPEDILEPKETSEIRIISGSFSPEQDDSYIPKRVELYLGLNNKVVWINEDEIGHTITTDNDSEDQFSGRFDSLDIMGILKPGETYEFLFTQEGEFPYHCEPHPWMKGVVKVIKQKF